jgi:hypothetical protein
LGDYLHVIGNNSLTNLAGLGNLTSVGYYLTIENNASLTNVDGLSNITSVGSTLNVTSNGSLDRFCGLYPLLSSGGFVGSYYVWGNLVNPTQQQIIDDGPCLTTAITKNKLLPKDYTLQQNFPNPFNPITTISYSLPEQSTVKLTVFDIQGREIIKFHDADNLPGTYKVQWNCIDKSGNPVSTGVYFCRLEAGTFSQTIKMVYLR